MPRDRYEDEIRDILNHMDNFVPDGDPRERPKAPPPRKQPPKKSMFGNLKRQLSGYSSSTFMVSCILLALVAGLTSKIYPPLGGIAAILSVASLVMAIALPMIGSRSGPGERRWRGQVIDYEQPARIRRPFSWRYTWWRLRSFFRFKR